MNYKFKTKPYAHQITALEKSWNKEAYAYFMEMGTGKSKVLIDNIAMLYDKGKINGALIIAPKGVYQNWHDIEIPTHMPDHIEKTMVLWRSTINQKQQLQLDTLFTSSYDLHILIMNVESLSTKKGLEFAAKFINCHNTMMEEMNISTMKLADGSAIEVKPVYGASIPKDRQEEAFNWLRNNGLGDLIKNEVTVSFGRNEDNKALQYATLAQGQGYEPVQKLKVEPMTLKATVRERIEKGLDMPSDLFNVFAGNKTKITRK